MSAEATVQQVIDNAIAKAEQLIDEAKGYSESAQTAAASFVSFDPPSLQAWAAAKAPTFDLDEDFSALFRYEFDNAYQKYLDLMSSKIAEFMVSYFPNFNALAVAEQWLVDAIQNGGTGLVADVENAIWQRSRDKEHIEANRMEEEAIAAVAARGFALPTGALTARLQEVQQAAADKVSTHARDVAIKQAEIELSNTRFAVEQSLAHRRAVINSAMEYMRAYMMAPDMAIKEASALVDAKGSLFRNASVYYEMELRAEGMRRDRAFKIADLDIQAGSIATDAFVKNAASRAHAAVALAEASGRSASAALASLNSIAHIGNVTNL